MTERIATSISAIREAVQQNLALKHPDLNDCLGQVSSAMKMFESAWSPGTTEEILGAYEEALGGQVPEPVGDAAITQTGMLLKFLITEWAAGLAAAMDIQLARGWNPEVAWQRSLAGFGLNAREMRGYIASVIRPSDSASDAVVSTTAKKRAAILTAKAAMKIAESEVSATRKAAKVISAAMSPEPTVAGLAVHAADTGRVLMLQRALDPKDPAGGTWEFPGGHIDPGDVSPLHGAVREWREEVGRRAPAGKLVGSWDHNNYRGYVVTVDHEKDVPIGNGRGTITNPDDPDGDQIEQLAWWSPDQLSQNPALRAELRASMKKVRGVIPESVSKAFEFTEDQRRQFASKQTRSHGRFIRMAHTATKEKVAPDAVDIALQESNIAEERGNSLGNPQKGSLTASQNNALGTPQSNPFAHSQNNPFAASQRDAFLHPDSGIDLVPHKKHGRNRLLVVIMPGPASEKKPGDVPPEDSSSASLFFPISDAADFFNDHDHDPTLQPDALGHGNIVDFGKIANYYDVVRNRDVTMRLSPGATPWDMDSSGDFEVDPDEWQEAVHMARPLWDEVSENASDYADEVDDFMASDIAALAGYGTRVDARTFKSLIAEAVGRRDSGASEDAADPNERYDPSPINALADYMVWQQPDMIPGGKRLSKFMEYSETMDKMDQRPISSVMSFTNLAPGDTPRSMRGQYKNSWTSYHSALNDMGQDAEPGVVGLRESLMKPVGRSMYDTEPDDDED